VLRHWFEESWKYHTELCENCWGTGRELPGWCNLAVVAPIAIIATLVLLTIGVILWDGPH
jgi:hypothetical protein